MKRIILILALLCSSAFAENFYISNAGGSVTCNGGTQTTQAPSWFNTAGNWANPKVAGKVGPGDTVFLCGTITGTANTPALVAQVSGSNGNPVTIKFDTNAVVSGPYAHAATGAASCGGWICAQGLSYIVLDGNTTGVVANTANGSSPTYANQQSTLLVDFHNCQPGCTVKNLLFQNAYVVNNSSDTMNSTNILALLPPGTNGLTSGNDFSNCGWCLYYGWQNGDDSVEIANNKCSSAYGHCMAIFTGSSTAALTNLKIHDNDFAGPGTAWDNGVGCPNHKDGIHVYGPGGTNSLDNFYVYNNYFHGDWGACPTGWFFLEGTSNAPGLKNFSAWNNVGIVASSPTQIVNTNGWFVVANGTTGAQKLYNNTIIGAGTIDNALGFEFSNLSGLTFENNVTSGIQDPIRIDSSTVTALDYNLYGAQTCGNGNCFIWNGSFKGSLAAWKTASGEGANTTQNASPLLNSDGSPQSGSPLISAGTNLNSISTGNLATLANATTQGNNLTALARPGNGAGNWTLGAYNLFYTLTVAGVGSGNGTVTSGDSLVSCTLTAGVTSGTCSAEYNSGGTSTLTANASGGSTLTSLTGGGCSGSPCTVTMNANTTVTASINTNTSPGITFSCVSPIKNGATSLCSWTVTGSPFSACSIGAVDITSTCASGTHTFTVNGQTTYTLSATNASGTSQASFTVTMGGATITSGVKLPSGVAIQ